MAKKQFKTQKRASTTMKRASTTMKRASTTMKRASTTMKMPSTTMKMPSNTMKIVLRTPIRRRHTRQAVPNSVYELASEWVAELNYYNFSDIWRAKGKMPIFYKLINVFLLSIQFNELRDINYLKEAIRDILNYYNSTSREQEVPIDSDTIIEALLENIIILYKHVQVFPRGHKLISIDFHLYHGIHKDSIIHKSLLNLQSHEIYELPIFMSTSVTRDVACRFTAESESKIIICITVRKELLDKFKYIFFGNTLIIGENNFITENEFLLNLFTKLKFINKISEEIIYKSPYIGDTYKTITDTFTIFNMEFVSHSEFTPEEVETILKKKIAEYLEKAQGKRMAPVEEEEAEWAEDMEEDTLGGGKKYKTNKTNKANKRKYKANKRNKTHKGKISIKKLSNKYKFKNKKS
jgi:hypothetical protein